MEKSYKEALERAREIYNAPAATIVVRTWLEQIFPELKESEEEKIRKELIGHCKDLVRMNQDDKVMLSIYEPWLAYLEKQKEQKSIEDVIKNITKNKETATEFLKSAGIMNDNGELAEMYRSEQKPLSTEETELNSIAFLEQLGYTCVPPGVKQKPAEWSEEDERILKRLIRDYNEAVRSSNGNAWEKDFQENLNWLESLRPQPHWKPSNDQMYILNWVANILLNHDGIVEEAAKELQSLYNDLEKL